jgi:hypothetical protein
VVGSSAPRILTPSSLPRGVPGSSFSLRSLSHSLRHLSRFSLFPPPSLGSPAPPPHAPPLRLSRDPWPPSAGRLRPRQHRCRLRLRPAPGSRRGGGIFKSRLGAIGHGAELGAEMCGIELGAIAYGAELHVMSAPRLPWGYHLGAMAYGAETCYLGAIGHGADPRSKRGNTSLRDLNMSFFG